MIDEPTVIDKRPTERPSPEVVLRDRQNLLALRPPDDPVTGAMVYDTPQAAQYRKALQGIVDHYGSIENFQDALKKFAAVPASQLAPAAAPGAPGQPGLANGPPAPNMAGPPAASSLAQFARGLMGPGGPPAAAGNAAPPALMPRRGAGTTG